MERLYNMEMYLMILLIILLLLVQGRSNNVQHIWPISNNTFGSNIIYSPGSYIGQEYNGTNLFVGGKLGSYVISPVDGKIISVFFQYLYSLKRSEIYSEVYIDQLKKSKSDYSSIDLKNITLTIGIEIAPGDILYLSGIGKDRLLKTGSRLKHGDTLGLLAYAYKEVNSPSLMIGRSINGISADPMEPLGLKTTFNQNYPKVDPLELISPDSLKADFLIFRASLEEGHPGLYDYILKAKLDKIFDSIFQSIHSPLSVLDFEDILVSLTQLIRDQHTQILTNYDEIKLRDYKMRKMQVWPVRIGWEDNFLVVTGATHTYKSLIGKTIKSINGIEASSLKKRAGKYCFREGYVESSRDFYLFTSWMIELPAILNLEDDKSLSIVFSDGTNLRVESVTLSNLKNDQVLPSWKGYLNRWNKDITYKLVNDSTALVDLSTFDLNDVQTDSIFHFIRRIVLKGVPNLIIDVRYNKGGDHESVATIFSLFAQKPFRLTEAEKVNRKGTYNLFHYTQNFEGVDNLFKDYKEIAGKSGYWLPSEKITEYFPNDSLKYKGHIYILANEHSFSAASLFVALMHKYHLGIIIGRETANPYHQMYADKFALVQLPNTQIVVRIPLVKRVFDTTENTRILFGQGVLPDFMIPLVRGELEFQTDTYVEKAVELIANRIFMHYEDDILLGRNQSKKLLFAVLAVVILSMVITILYYLYYSKKFRG